MDIKSVTFKQAIDLPGASQSAHTQITAGLGEAGSVRVWKLAISEPWIPSHHVVVRTTKAPKHLPPDAGEIFTAYIPIEAVARWEPFEESVKPKA